MIILNNISKEFADKKLFENLNLTIYDGEKIGIVGANGSGKSTLMNIISKDLLPECGQVNLIGNIEYVKQSTDFDNNKTIDENIEFKKLCQEIELNKNFEELNGNTQNFSGGEKTKLALIKAFNNTSASIILLDEPTNHLDENGILWLIEKIKNFEGTIVAISHDRFFLNQIANKIIEIENGQVFEYYGNYDDYYLQKTEKIEFEKKQYAFQKSLNQKIENQIAKLKQKAHELDKNSRRDGSSDKRSKGFKGGMAVKASKLSKQAKAKETRLVQEKQKMIERPVEAKEIFYKLNAQNIGSKVLIKAENISKSFGTNTLFENANFVIENGEKVALCGLNGCGKTTLLKMILEKEPFNGHIWLSSAVKIAYLSQDVFDLKNNSTIIDFASQNGYEYKTKFLTNLANMGLDKQLFNKKINTLSLGERMKIKINEIILSDYNLLILDEPANHLDINNKIFLENVLKNFDGSLIIVSHDKSFVKNVCNKILKIENKTISKQDIYN